MRYTDLARALAGDPLRMHLCARVALLPYLKHRQVPAAQVREQLRIDSSVAAIPEILNVPRRVLKRWATRAASEAPRGKFMKGPRLAMYRRGTMYPSIRGFLP